MYEETLCDATTSPTFATAGLSPNLFAEMERDLAELRRIEAAITPEELEEMEQLYRQQQNIRVTPCPMGYRAEVRYPDSTPSYPGDECWSYVGIYRDEDLAEQRALEQLDAALTIRVRRTA